MTTDDGFLDMFSGTPVERCLDVVFNASRSLARREVERLIERLALCELAVRDFAPDVDLDSLATLALTDDSLKKRLGVERDSIALESMSNILSENE